jgi:competence protein ComEA
VKPEPVVLKNRNPVPDKSGSWARLALGALLVISLGVLGLYRWLGDNEPPIEPVTLDNVTVTPKPGRSATDQIVVYVVGEVNRPGVVSLPAGSRVVDAIKAAGGLTERANQFGVNLAARLHDEEMVKVYAQGETIPETATPAPVETAEEYPVGGEEPPPPPPSDPAPAPPDLTPPPPAGHFQGGEIPPAAAVTPPPPPAAPATPAPPSGDTTPAAPPPKAGPKVSLNRGTVEQLEAIPGVGPKLAAQIVAYRRGPPPRAFTTLEDLTRVPGIKQAKLDELRAFITL